VHARGLCKRFGTVEAVRGIDVDVRLAETFGFLGPNSAGKSSTMRMIAFVSPRSAGELQVFGMDPDIEGPRIRARLGVVPQQDNRDNGFSVWENLRVYEAFGNPLNGVGVPA
jgi:lipooligosaccharide transport system ATP-binding protein